MEYPPQLCNTPNLSYTDYRLKAGSAGWPSLALNFFAFRGKPNHKTGGRYYLVGRYYIVEEQHKNMTEKRHYSIGRHCIIEERHKNITEKRHYSIGRRCIIEERHKNMTEGQNYSTGRHCSVGDWCRNVLRCKRVGEVCPKSFDYGQNHPLMNCVLIDQVH